VALVTQLLELRKQKAQAKAADDALFQGLIAHVDGQIDTLVYALYGLTPEEIAVVENAAP
jgi:hypothetical protein